MGQHDQPAAVAILLHFDQDPADRVDPSQQEVPLPTAGGRFGHAVRVFDGPRRDAGATHRRDAGATGGYRRDAIATIAGEAEAQLGLEVRLEDGVDRAGPEDVVILVDQGILHEAAHQRRPAIDREAPRPQDGRPKQPGPIGRRLQGDLFAVARLLVNHRPNEQPSLAVAKHGQRRDGRVGGLAQLGQGPHFQGQGRVEADAGRAVGRSAAGRRGVVRLRIDVVHRTRHAPPFLSLEAGEVERLQQAAQHGFRRCMAFVCAELRRHEFRQMVRVLGRMIHRRAKQGAWGTEYPVPGTRYLTSDRLSCLPPRPCRRQ